MGKDRKSYVGAYMPHSLHHPRHIDTRARGAIHSTTYHIYTAGVRTAKVLYYEVGSANPTSLGGHFFHYPIMVR